VHDSCGSSACHKRFLVVLLDGVLGERRESRPERQRSAIQP
jgi:hypothetical protein